MKTTPFRMVFIIRVPWNMDLKNFPLAMNVSVSCFIPV